MDIIDVSPDDLVLPGGCLGRAVLSENYAWTIPQTALTDSPAGTHPGIKVMHPGSRDRLRRVLAAGERCERCHGTGRITGRVTWPDADCERCNGTGYTRQPHDLGHFIDAEIAGRITPLAAAGLMWASVLRVEAGLGPVTYVNGAEDRRRRSPTMSDVSALLDNDHILLPLPDRIARLRLEG